MNRVIGFLGYIPISLEGIFALVLLISSIQGKKYWEASVLVVGIIISIVVIGIYISEEKEKEDEPN